MDVDNWEASSKNRASWGKLVEERRSTFKLKLVEHAALKHVLRMQDDRAVSSDVLQELKCSVCGRFHLSKRGMEITSNRHSEAVVYEEARKCITSNSPPSSLLPPPPPLLSHSAILGLKY